MTTYRVGEAEEDVLKEYLEHKRREFIAASGEEAGTHDAEALSEDLHSLASRIENRWQNHETNDLCYLVMGRVQSGKTGHQLGMLAWAVDNCDLAVIFTGVTEALNGQTSYRIGTDLGTLPSSPVATQNVPTRANAERDTTFLESIVRRTRHRRQYRAGGTWPEPLPILVSMKTKPRVDALKWLLQQVSETVGDGVTVLIIDDEADQASPNASTRRGEEAATYTELKALRDAAAKHVWLSYTATPQAIFLTERDGALRPDFCAVLQPGTQYFGVEALMSPDHRMSRVSVTDWAGNIRRPNHVPPSLKRALCDLLTAAWLRSRSPQAFYQGDGSKPATGMRSVQMLVHTSSKQLDHISDFESIENGLAELRSEIERAINDPENHAVPAPLQSSWSALVARLASRRGEGLEIGELGPEELWQIGRLVSRVEIRVVNSDPNRPTAPAGPLPTDRAGWEAHPLWIVVGGDILGRGLTFPQLVTTYFTRMAQTSNEDTVSQQMRFCGYRSTYAHVLTVHAAPDIFDSFAYLARLERTLLSRAEGWQTKDKNLLLEEPALWYVTDPAASMRPTRLAVRDRELEDRVKSQQILSISQFFQPSSFIRNSKEFLLWVSGHEFTEVPEESWLLVECDSQDVTSLLERFRMAGRDDAGREVALELMNPRLGDLGLADLPYAVFWRGADVLRCAAEGHRPSLGGLPVRQLVLPIPGNASTSWQEAWGNQGSISKEQWFDTIRLRVPHVGDEQRRPLRSLHYDAVSVIMEPVAGYADSIGHPVAAGVAVSILAPKGYRVRAVGVRDSSG